MKVLITGGAGFIGSYLCERLFELGHHVVILDNLQPQIHPDWEGSFLFHKIYDKCKFIKGDICNRTDVLKALDGIEAIIHLAAETGTGQSMYEIDRYYRVNVQGTALLFDVLVNTKHTVKKFIVASSRAIYGEGKYLSRTLGIQYPESRYESDMQNKIFDLLSPDTREMMQCLPTDEESRLHPASVYGLTKLAQEQLTMLMGKKLNIPSVALRFQNVYGPGQSLANPYTGLLAVFSNRIRGGKPLDIYEDGNESRDFVYITDVIDSILLSLENENANYEVFNVGSGVPTKIIDVAKLMCCYFNKDVEITISNKYRVGDIRHNYADLKKVKTAIGFQPTVSFEQGIRQFVDWVQQQGIVEDKYESSIEEMRSKGLMK